MAIVAATSRRPRCRGVVLANGPSKNACCKGPVIGVDLALTFQLNSTEVKRAWRKNAPISGARLFRGARSREETMRKTLPLLVGAALALSATSALAQKKQLVIVVKGLDNPFFEAIHQGCEKWNKENAASPYACFYTGPASTSDEAGEAQIVQDMLGKADTVAIAISPSNAPLIANTIKAAKPKVPVMTLDADLKKEDAALRKTYLGTDNYLMGVKLGQYLAKAQPKGGTLCTIEGNPAADNILRRAQGSRDGG